MLMSHAIEDPSTLEELNRRLVLESQVISDVMGVFSRILPKAHGLVVSFIPSLENQVAIAPVQLKSDLFRRVLKQVSTVNFIAYRDTLVTVPESFEGDYVSFIQLMLQMREPLFTKAFSFVDSYRTQLSLFLSDADSRLSQKNTSSQLLVIQGERERYEKGLQKFFSSKHHGATRKKMGTVISRFSDLERVFVGVEKLQTQYRREDYSKLLSMVTETTDLLKLINQRIDEGDIDKISGPMAKTLSTGAYELARYVELVSLYGYLTLSTMGSVTATAETLDALFTQR